MFDSDSDHTVPSSSVMVYRPSFYPLKESRERRMKTQYMPTTTVHSFQPTKLEGYCVPHQLSCNMSSCGYNETDNFSGYNIPLEPETPEDDFGVEEILVGLCDASDGWYRPTYDRIRSLPPRKRFSTDVRVPSQDDDLSPPASPFQGRISQIVQQQQGSVNMMKKRRLTPPQSPEDEPRLVESGDEEHPSRYVSYGLDDEIELEPKRKVKKARVIKKESSGIPNAAVEVGSTNDEEGGVCGKTNKPRQRKEYFYSKNSKTIFRWTCCGSQAKDHPDF